MWPTEKQQEDIYYEYNGSIYRDGCEVYGDVDSDQLSDAIDACNDLFDEHYDHSFNWYDVISRIE